jgi:hypothetical protein
LSTGNTTRPFHRWFRGGSGIGNEILRLPTHKPDCLMASDKRGWAWSWPQQCSPKNELQEPKIPFKLNAPDDSNRSGTEFHGIGSKILLISTYKLNTSPFVWWHQTNGLVLDLGIVEILFDRTLYFPIEFMPVAFCVVLWY